LFIPKKGQIEEMEMNEKERNGEESEKYRQIIGAIVNR
jgi:hypothetical protein